MTYPRVVDTWPDVELALLMLLVPMEPGIRFVTVMPAQVTGMVARIHRISGANRDIYLDKAIVDIDVFGMKSDTVSVSQAARAIQADMLSLMSATSMIGVVQHVTTIAGPRQLPEANQTLVRYSASYEVTTTNSPGG
jgi:hypothetical protein